MKKLLLLGLILGVCLGGYAQQRAGHVKNADKLKYSVKKPFRKSIDNPEHFLVQQGAFAPKSGLAINETQVGMTIYDLQSNASNQNRIYLHNDGTIGAAWTYGVNQTASFSDRGTGYNYYDGSAWGPEPTARIEDVKTGWPSYMPSNATGELVISHIGTTAGLKVARRDVKGTGTWNYSNFAGPASAPELLWPRAIASGSNNQYIHLVGLTAPVANQGTLYNGQDGSLLYSRSSDGGVTWDIQNFQFPQTDTAYYKGFGGDCYAWANPQGNTIAFVYANDWEDAFLMKSEDNGATWTKTLIFQHPYPKFVESTTLVLDTPTVCDGFVTVGLDNSGKAHVFFGMMRVLNDDLTDGNTSYFPYTDGLAYWNEDMPTHTVMDIDQFYDDGLLVGYTQDLNGNDTILEYLFETSDPDGPIGLYFASITSMPTVTIDDDNKIYLFFTTVCEGIDNDNQNYRHIFYRRSDDLGASWTDFVDVTGSIIHNFDECVFPSLSFTSDDNLHLLYQKDNEPGLHIRGDEDAAGDNFMIYLKMSKTSAGIADGQSNITYVTQNYPNPAAETTKVTVNLKNSAELSLTVTNFMGQKVFEVPAAAAQSGYHTFTLDVSSLAPGVYTYTVKAGTQTMTRKMIVE